MLKLGSQASVANASTCFLLTTEPAQAQ